MNAIYSGCIPNPWLEIAIKLNKDINIKPACWIGWKNYDNNIDIKTEIENNFPDCIFFDIDITWKAVFPQVTDSIKSESLDEEMIRSIASYELIAIKMMDRLDPNRKSFTFEERQRHFRLLLSKWLGVITEKKIDLFISPSIPHRVFDYALYVACKIKGVKTLFFKLTSFRDVLIPIPDIESMPIEIKQSYKRIKDKDIDVTLPPRMVESINLLKKSYEEAEPLYMKVQKKTNKVSLFNLLSKAIKNPRSLLYYIHFFRNTKKYHKVPGKKMEEVFLKRYQLFFYKYKGIFYKRNLKRYYESLCSEINFKEEKFVFVALHYQPEETTSPSAGHYVNQNLIIENLSEILPNDIKIVVKEHSSQFHKNMEGHTGRQKMFYDDLLKTPRVILVSSDSPSFKYIDNSIAVATATGTIGWESIVRGKPVLIFGNAWYEYCDNVYRIHSKLDLKEALSKIINHKNNKADYLGYAKAIQKNAIYAYHYKGYDKKSNISKDDSVKNLSSSIISFIKTFND